MVAHGMIGSMATRATFHVRAVMLPGGGEAVEWWVGTRCWLARRRWSRAGSASS